MMNETPGAASAQICLTKAQMDLLLHALVIAKLADEDVAGDINYPESRRRRAQENYEQLEALQWDIRAQVVDMYPSRPYIKD